MSNLTDNLADIREFGSRKVAKPNKTVDLFEIARAKASQPSAFRFE